MRLRRYLGLGVMLGAAGGSAVLAEEVVYAPMVLTAVTDLENSRFEFHTLLRVQSISGAPTQAEVEFFESGGEPSDILCVPPPFSPNPPFWGPCFYDSRRQFDLAPYQVDTGSRSFADFPLWPRWEGFLEPRMNVGWVKVTSGAPVKVLVELRSARIGGGEDDLRSVLYAPLPAGREFVALMPSYDFAVCLESCRSEAEGRRPALALLNPSESEAAQVVLRLRNLEGGEEAVEELTLEPLEARNGFLFDGGDFFGDRPRQTGSVEIGSTLPVAPLLLEVDGIDWRAGTVFPLPASP